MRSLLAVFLLSAPLSAQQPKTTIEVPEKYVLGLAYSPDGKILASSGSVRPTIDLEIHFWDTTTNKELKVLKIPGKTLPPIIPLRFSPDGKMLAAGGDLQLWDLATDKPTALDENGLGARSVSFNPDGKTLATGDSTRAVRIWDVKTGKQQTQINEPSSCATFTPDGKTLIYGTGITAGFIKLWDVAPRKEKTAIRAENDQVHSLACTNEIIAYHSTVLKGSEWVTTVHLIDFTGKELHRLKGHDSYLYAIVFSPDGKLLATASADETVGVWDVATGKQLAKLPFWSTVVAFSPDGKTLAVGTRQKTIMFWDIEQLAKK